MLSPWECTLRQPIVLTVFIINICGLGPGQIQCTDIWFQTTYRQYIVAIVVYFPTWLLNLHQQVFKCQCFYSDVIPRTLVIINCHFIRVLINCHFIRVTDQLPLHKSTKVKCETMTTHSSWSMIKQSHTHYKWEYKMKIRNSSGLNKVTNWLYC